VTRVLSGVVLIAVAIGVVWFAPPALFFAVGFLIAALAVNELVALARASRLEVSTSAAGFATALVVGSSAVAGMLEPKWTAKTSVATTNRRASMPSRHTLRAEAGSR
jgi:CDP-diglyceride synthetase